MEHSTIDQLFEATHSSGVATTLEVDASWAQGRTVLGGLSAALLLHACQRKVPPNMAVRSVYTSFVGPLLVNTPFTLQVSVLRQGKNVTQLLAQAIQNDQVAVIQQTSFGAKRASQLNFKKIPKLNMKGPADAVFIEASSGLIPSFAQHFDVGVVDGGLPFSNSETSHTHGWMRFKQAPKAISIPHICCLADVWPPTVIQMLDGAAPLSTMNWYLEFLDAEPECGPEDWLAYQCDASCSKDGYAHSDAFLWTEKGDIIAKSHQTIAVFA